MSMPEYDLDTRTIFREAYMLQAGYKVGDLVIPVFRSKVAIVTHVDPQGRITGWRELGWDGIRR